MGGATINPYLIGLTRYQVVAPCVVAMLPGGHERYVYRHGLLPDNTLPHQVEHMLASGQIRAFEEVPQ